jgi:hypothetical protein
MDGNGSEPDMVTSVLPLIRPQLRHLLWRYRIPVAAIVEVLERALMAAEETWEQGAGKENWLLAAVELECGAYWRGRRRRPPARRRGQTLGIQYARTRTRAATGCRRSMMRSGR